MTLGEKIRSLRKTAGLSQEALAEKLGVSRQAVSKWENDNGMPETEKLITMAKLFDTSLDNLIGEEPATPTASPAAENNTSTQVDPSSVTLEVAGGFLNYQSNRFRRIALTALLIIGSSSLAFSSFTGLIMLLWMLIIIVAVAQLILAYAIADPYRALRRMPLTLTPDARTEITGRFSDEQPKLQRLLFCGILLVGIGFCLAPLLVTNDHPLTDDLIFAGGMIFAGAGAYLCIYTGGLLRTYRQLLETNPSQRSDHP